MFNCSNSFSNPMPEVKESSALFSAGKALFSSSFSSPPSSLPSLSFWYSTALSLGNLPTLQVIISGLKSSCRRNLLPDNLRSSNMMRNWRKSSGSLYVQVSLLPLLVKPVMEIGRFFSPLPLLVCPVVSSRGGSPRAISWISLQ